MTEKELEQLALDTMRDINNAAAYAKATILFKALMLVYGKAYKIAQHDVYDAMK